MVQAATLAHLHEEKLVNSCQVFRRHPTLSLPSCPPALHSLVPISPPTLLPTPSQSPSIPFKRFSPEELAIRREKGLYFNCDEKFKRSHRCSSKLFLLIATDDDTSSNNLISQWIRKRITRWLPLFHPKSVCTPSRAIWFQKHYAWWAELIVIRYGY